jgi:hypothetical protein
MIEAGHQPDYIPWLGFFDKIKNCDVFIIEDNIQFERQGFRNRNRIKTSDGVKWLTVPIKHVGNNVPINEVQINNYAERDWAERHWLTIKHNYSRSPYWDKYSTLIEEVYCQRWDLLIDFNMHFIKLIMGLLDIKKPLVYASNLESSGKKCELLISQCKALGADTHLSGSGGLDYIDKGRFEQEGIKLIFQDFKYPVYDQLYGEYEPNLSVIDYLLCTGGAPWVSHYIEIVEEDGKNG